MVTMMESMEQPSVTMPTDQPGSVAAAITGYLRYLADYAHAAPLTITSYRPVLEGFAEWVRKHRGPDATPADVDRYLMTDYAAEIGGQPGTVSRKLASIQGFFRWCVYRGIAEMNPVKGVERPKQSYREVKPMSPEEIKAMVMVANPREQVALGLMYCAAMRRGEVAAVRLADLELEAKMLLVHGKGDKERIVALNEDAITLITRYLKVRRPRWPTCDFLVVNRWGHPVSGGLIWAWVKSLARRAGLNPDDIHPHRFRHSAATHMHQNGADTRTIQELMGHSDISTTARYLHTDKAHKAAAVAPLKVLG